MKTEGIYAGCIVSLQVFHNKTHNLLTWLATLIRRKHLLVLPVNVHFSVPFLTLLSDSNTDKPSHYTVGCGFLVWNKENQCTTDSLANKHMMVCCCEFIHCDAFSQYTAGLKYIFACSLHIYLFISLIAAVKWTCWCHYRLYSLDKCN